MQYQLMMIGKTVEYDIERRKTVFFGMKIVFISSRVNQINPAKVWSMNQNNQLLIKFF